MDKTLELIKLAKDGNVDARDKIVSENLGLVWSVVRRFGNRGYELDDLYQIGCIGLIKSIDKFDLSYEVRFSTYAVPMITGEIKRFLRDDGMIKVSRSLKEIAYKVKIEKEKYINKYCKEPTISQLAASLEIEEEEIVAALEANSDVESIYKTIYQSDGNSIYLIDKLARVEDDSDRIADSIALNNMIDNLEEKEKQLVMLRYYQDKTQTDIAKVLGISQVQVSRMEKKILLKLRKQLE